MKRAALGQLVLAATLAAGRAGAQEGTPSGATPSSEGKAAVKLTKAPVLVHPVQPELPAGEERGATVVLAITIGVDGAVQDASVLQSGGPRFDAATLAAARRLVFTPAEVNGRPTAVKIRYAYTFSPPAPSPTPAPTPTLTPTRTPTPAPTPPMSPLPTPAPSDAATRP